MNEAVQKVVDYIRERKGELCISREMEKVLDFPLHQNQRHLKIAIREAVNEGAPIVANSQGYWWGSQEDLKRNAQELRGRAASILARAELLEHYAAAA